MRQSPRSTLHGGCALTREFWCAHNGFDEAIALCYCCLVVVLFDSVRRDHRRAPYWYACSLFSGRAISDYRIAKPLHCVCENGATASRQDHAGATLLPSVLSCLSWPWLSVIALGPSFPPNLLPLPSISNRNRTTYPFSPSCPLRQSPNPAPCPSLLELVWKKTECH